jgi:hypothetical protein
MVLEPNYTVPKVICSKFNKFFYLLNPFPIVAFEQVRLLNNFFNR